MGILRKALLAVVCLLPVSAWAVDGVIEINAARAVAGGVTGGDQPGYPVTISQPGSYRLTGSLEQPNDQTSVIEVTSSDVHLDLNGFNIVGIPGGCFRGLNQDNCPPFDQNATAWGITSAFANVTITNGTVTRIHGGGIRLQGPYSQVQGVNVTHCLNTGILFHNSFGGQVDDVLVASNGGLGLDGGSVDPKGLALGTKIRAFHNRFYGIRGADLLSEVVAANNNPQGDSVFGINAISNCNISGGLALSSPNSVWTACLVQGSVTAAVPDQSRAVPVP
jgi:hypothetical protein